VNAGADGGGADGRKKNGGAAYAGTFGAWHSARTFPIRENSCTFVDKYKRAQLAPIRGKITCAKPTLSSTFDF